MTREVAFPTAPQSRRPAANGREPWSEEAEISALGCLFLDDGEAARRVVELVPVDALYKPSHRAILRAARKIIARGDDVDAVTLADELQSKGRLEQVGGHVALARLVDAVAGSAGLESWASTIRRKAFARDACEALDEEREAIAVASAGDVPALLERTERRLQDLREAHFPASTEDDDPGIATAEEILDNDSASEEWEAVADRIAWRSRLVMLAGREKLGKSTLLAEAASAVTRGLTEWARK